MTAKNLQDLKDKVKYLGIPEKVYKTMEEALATGIPDVSVGTDDKIGQDKMAYLLNFHQGKNGDYYLNSVDATLTKGIRIFPGTVNEIDIKALDEEMGKTNWKIHRDMFNNMADLTETEYQVLRDQNRVMEKLMQLGSEGNERGMAVQELLMVKYFRDTVFAETIPDFHKMAAKHEVKQNFPTTIEESYTGKEMYNMMWGRGVKNEINPQLKKGQNQVAQQEVQDPEDATQDNAILKKKHQAYVILDFNVKTKKGNYLMKYFYRQTAEQVKKDGPKFNVARKAAELPYLERDDPKTFAWTIESLEKGNLTKVHFPIEGKSVPFTLETNLRTRSLTAKDMEGNIVPHAYLGKDQSVDVTPIIKKYQEYMVKNEGKNHSYYRRPAKAMVKVKTRGEELSL
ncbi:hypothetical protein J2T02_002575 [Chitinophaga terrae (ex Kim and Jung 2007)]|uniref:hypothetical protein n=1 Tax=Chitinophaga terrae (ex Kim and Jung 2007) TaxID=408074 RepID=UPI002787A893|nr:hypothetical protein [Chitinophaga terrae (ex Kim and Jung 2007)]MDQ0107456.1 hypothetical protein [Chitinophaga terrae (ex Kim and Jung 2007)]